MLLAKWNLIVEMSVTG